MSPMSRAEAIFFAALERAPADRAAFLDQTCAGDAELRARLEQMLAAQSRLGDFLDVRSAAPTEEATGPAGAPAEAPGTLVDGKYKLLQRIGEGGMGSVWMAEQLEPVRRRVAVKWIRSERGSSRMILARFEAERQAVALMDHPHIAKLLDAGTTGGSVGQPYFVMELVKGAPLTEFCDRHRLGIADRLRLFMQICSAVQHAHQKGIIHRDLKPNNILVELHDDKPVPKVIDFGLAKALSGQPLTEHTLFTGFGTVAGTPLYMAPEQAAFNAIDVDTRADIYALGVILYELLTGTTPIEREQFKKAALDEVLRLIREREPPTPSQRLSSTGSEPSVAANRQTEPAKLGRFVRGELDWIVMKALAKERDRRYETATGLARDLERFLHHEPVQAGPPTAAYRVRKFVRRNRPQVVAGVLLLLALLLGIAGTTFGLVRADRRRAEAEQARADEFRRRQQARDALDAMTSQMMGDWLGKQEQVLPEHRAFLEKALASYEEFAADTGQDEAARAGVASAYLRAGNIRVKLGSSAEAEQAYERARQLYTQLAANFPLVPTYRKGLADSHVGLYRRMFRRLPREAEKALRAALVLQRQLATDYPKEPTYREDLAWTYTDLGTLLLYGLDRLQEVEECYRTALDLRTQLHADFPNVPSYRRLAAGSRIDVANILLALGRPKEAEVQMQVALPIYQQLAADFPTVENRKGQAWARGRQADLLETVGRLQEAEVAHRAVAILYQRLFSEYPSDLNYRHFLAERHYILGGCLKKQGRMDEAIVEYREAVQLWPELATFHCYLGLALQDQGKFAEALEELRRGHELGQKTPRWSIRSADLVKGCERLVELDGKLPALLKGEAKPADTAERLALARLCQLPAKQLDAAAARWYAEAFAAEPKVASELQAGYRYDAACTAALAGCGQGKDAAGLDEKERSRLRQQALDWLRDDLRAWQQALEKDPGKAGPTVAQQMRHWLQDADFNGVRGDEALARLPESERQPWQQLWTDVADTLTRSQGKAAPPAKSEAGQKNPPNP